MEIHNCNRKDYFKSTLRICERHCIHKNIDIHV